MSCPDFFGFCSVEHNKHSSVEDCAAHGIIRCVTMLCFQFFIGLDPSVPKEQYWSTRYQVRDVMIPYFISADLAKQLFTGGKSVAFMRNFCAGPSVITGMDVYSSLSDCSFTGSDPIWHFHNNQLKAMDAASLLGACKLANRNVTNLLKNDHNLGAHLSVRECNHEKCFSWCR